MGNKIFKVHVKYAGTNFEVELSPDTSIYELKEKIQTKFHIKPKAQLLFCNGKLLEVEDHKTIKQARIPNGSKILCTVLTSQQVDPVIDVLDKIDKCAEDVESHLDSLISKRRELISEEAPEYKKLNMESKKCGEDLMKLFESLDTIECSETAHRTRRKQVATKINAILDKNDNFAMK